MNTNKKTKAQKQLEQARIERAYHRTCSGVQVNVMDLGAIFRAGEKAIDAGADDAALDIAIRAFVESIRQN